MGPEIHGAACLCMDIERHLLGKYLRIRRLREVAVAHNGLVRCADTRHYYSIMRCDRSRSGKRIERFRS
ncbi:hypothetical protein TSAR_015004 [Trichomalopsis sarcophagae]|uniref:Uncharacterized protein n=1 Tax=Trichomalopsis sarcophagae TaxID=543379 RepID=A0A232FC65_9HYME|nr:hypothetical protein TSAR_015004 [Trichomalopsis sarcophagae]